MITCLAANPAIDRTFEVESLVQGTVHRPVRMSELPGGKAINVARVAAALGADVEIIGFSGGHRGVWLNEQLKAEGLRAKLVKAKAETRSCLSVLDRAARTMTEFYETGNPIEPGEWSLLLERVEGAIRPGSWLAVSGSLPPNAPDRAYATILTLASTAGAKTALDASGAALREGLAAEPDLVKVNTAEATELLGGEITAELVSNALHELSALSSGPELTVITRGSEGAVALDDRGRIWRGTIDSRGPYPVGSGDSFMAGLLVARDRGEEWPAALRLALAAGTANADQPGPGKLDTKRVVELAALASISQVGG